MSPIVSHLIPAARLVSGAACLALALWSCAEAEPAGACRLSADCPVGQVCVSGLCGIAELPDVGLPDTTPAPDAEPDLCEGAVSPQLGQLVLNEVLAAVPTGDVGDANRDGVRDTDEDEFLELVNVSNQTLAIRGVQIFKEADTDPFLELQTGCLEPSQALVVFGGIQPGAPFPDLDGARIEIAPRAMRLTNGGLALRVQTPQGVTLFSDPYPGIEGASATLDPQLSSAAGVLVDHSLIANTPFSPGTCADGQSFLTGCPAPEPECPGAAAPTPETLLINEVLSAVPTGDAGDANGDGVRSSSADEFIEMINIGNTPIALRGVRIFKEEGEKTTLKTDCLRPGQALVVFAGLEDGAEPPDLGPVLVEIAAQTFGLTNGGSVLRLLDDENNELISLTLPSASGESLNRVVELSPDVGLVGHTRLANAPFSPGTCADGAPLSSGCPPPPPACPGAVDATAETLLINEVLSAVPTGDAGDANGDGVRSSSDDEFIEMINIGDAPITLRGLRIFKEDAEKATLQTECLQPGEALVVFAGLEDGAEPPDLGAVLVEISSRTWGLTNGGSVLRIVGVDGTEIISLTLQSASGESLTRSVDLEPASPLVGHTTLAPEALFSPGICALGGSVADGCR